MQSAWRTRRVRSKLLVVVGAGVALFVVNNFLLARILTRLPGGTVLAVTDMAVVAFLALRMPRFPTVATIYATYGVLGIIGHLGTDAVTYTRHLPVVLAAAVVYDGIIALGRYRWRGLVVGLLPFATIVLFAQPQPPAPARFLSALAWAGAGLVIGLAARFLADLRRRRDVGAAQAPPSPSH